MRYALIALVLAGCGALPGPTPPPVPSVDAAASHLDLVIDAGIAGDFERLCQLDDGERLLAGAAVFWTGTSVSFAPSGEVTMGEPPDEPSRC